MEINYKTRNTCSTEINIKISDGIINNVDFKGGCSGNLKAVAALVKGMKADEAVRKLKGIRCGNRETSCADQLTKAIESNLPN